MLSGWLLTDDAEVFFAVFILPNGASAEHFVDGPADHWAEAVGGASYEGAAVDLAHGWGDIGGLVEQALCTTRFNTCAGGVAVGSYWLYAEVGNSPPYDEGQMMAGVDLAVGLATVLERSLSAAGDG